MAGGRACAYNDVSVSMPSDEHERRRLCSPLAGDRASAYNDVSVSMSSHEHESVSIYIHTVGAYFRLSKYYRAGSATDRLRDSHARDAGSMLHTALLSRSLR